MNDVTVAEARTKVREAEKAILAILDGLHQELGVPVSDIRLSARTQFVGQQPRTYSVELEVLL